MRIQSDSKLSSIIIEPSPVDGLQTSVYLNGVLQGHVIEADTVQGYITQLFTAEDGSIKYVTSRGDVTLVVGKRYGI